MEEGSKFIVSVFYRGSTLHIFYKKHNGSPSTYAEKQEFKKIIRNIKKQRLKYIVAGRKLAFLLKSRKSNDQSVVKLQPSSRPFCHLAAALHLYTKNQLPYTHPHSSTLPDMKSSTAFYIELQKLYKKRAEEEKEMMRGE